MHKTQYLLLWLSMVLVGLGRQHLLTLFIGSSISNLIIFVEFRENTILNNCDEGQGRLSLCFQQNRDKPLFLYIDNGLKSRDLEQLLPKGLDSCLPPKSRILNTTRNRDETHKFVGKNIVRREYVVNPLPNEEARKLLLEKVSEYNDEDTIQKLLNLCGGVPLLLELAGSQLAINKENRGNIVLEMLNKGEQVEESDRMVGFVHSTLLPPDKEAFLDIASFFYKYFSSQEVASVVGKEEHRALEAASFVKTSKEGRLIVHDIIRARGKKLADQEGNRITDLNTLSQCLKDDEKLKKIRGILLDKEYEQPAIEINCHQINCMSNSLRVLRYKGSHITFRENCQTPFEQLRCLIIKGDVQVLPIPKFEKLEHLVYYEGPFTQGMNLHEFPPSLLFCSFIRHHSANRDTYSKIPASDILPSSHVRLGLHGFKNMKRLPDGVEKLTKLDSLSLVNCDQLRELLSKLTDLNNLKELTLSGCNELKELPSNFGHLRNLQELNLTNSQLVELPADFDQLQNLKKLTLCNCSRLEEWPLNFRNLRQIEQIVLVGCLPKLRDNSLPENAKRNSCGIIT